MVYSNVQVPSSISSIAEEIEGYVITSFPEIMSIDDFPESVQDRLFESTGKHEMFHQDADRFINDVYVKKANDEHF